jgi:hypothetical protein
MPRHHHAARGPQRSSFLLALFAIAALLTPPALAAQSWWESLLGGFGSEDVTATAPVDADAAAPVVDLAAGLREALVVGSERVVERLGAPGGFELDPELHIPLPESLRTVRSWMDRVGMAGPIDDLEVRLNRAAETATPRARALFVEAIRSMSFEDARAILEGSDSAATDYLRGRMQAPLAEELRPVIDEALAEVGAARLLEATLERYREIPFAPAVDMDLPDHVTAHAIDGIFMQLAREEQAIRRDPAQRTTELLRAVFGD